MFSVAAPCQVKEIIDRNIPLIKNIPSAPCPAGDLKSINKKNKEFRKKNPEFNEILLLDTLAIPYLIDKISDTTETTIQITCITYKLKNGDVAFELLKEIIFIPMYAVSHQQWDLLYGCDSLCDYMYYLSHDRLKFQTELKTFFESQNGKIWLRLFYKKLSKTERADLMKKLNFN